MPSDDPTGETFLDKINLPKLVAGPAGEAISRFVAGATDIPVAWLERYSQGIRDTTLARSEVSRALSKAVADRVVNDPAIIERAAHAFLATEIRKQANKENIASKTIEELDLTADAEATDPGDDWLNLYTRFAEDASSDRMQDMWAKILAGQIRRPKAFSLQTLRVVAELDAEAVQLFEKWSSKIFNGQAIPYPIKSGPEFSELLELENLGLLAGISTLLNQQFSIAETELVPAFVMGFRSHALIIQVQKPFVVNVPSALLTKVGRQLISVTKGESTLEMIETVVEQLPKNGIVRIDCVNTAVENSAGVMLWNASQNQH